MGSLLDRKMYRLLWSTRERDVCNLCNAYRFSLHHQTFSIDPFLSFCGAMGRCMFLVGLPRSYGESDLMDHHHHQQHMEHHTELCYRNRKRRTVMGQSMTRNVLVMISWICLNLALRRGTSIWARSYMLIFSRRGCSRRPRIWFVP
jgi:hypothetical protein